MWNGYGMYSDRINPDIDDLVIWNVFLNCIVIEWI